MRGMFAIHAAKAKAEASLAEPRLCVLTSILRAIAHDIEMPGLSPYLVERGLETMDKLADAYIKHGGLVK